MSLQVEQKAWKSSFEAALSLNRILERLEESEIWLLEGLGGSSQLLERPQGLGVGYW